MEWDVFYKNLLENVLLIQVVIKDVNLILEAMENVSLEIIHKQQVHVLLEVVLMCNFLLQINVMTIKKDVLVMELSVYQ